MKHKSRGVGKGVGGIGGRSGEGSEGSGRAEIIRIRGKMEEKGDIITKGWKKVILSQETTSPLCADVSRAVLVPPTGNGVLN